MEEISLCFKDLDLTTLCLFPFNASSLLQIANFKNLVDLSIAYNRPSVDDKVIITICDNCILLKKFDIGGKQNFNILLRIVNQFVKMQHCEFFTSRYQYLKLIFPCRL